MNKQQAQVLVHNLYQAVDNKDIRQLDKLLAEQLRFRIGNHSAETDKSLVLAANRQFFSSIRSMSHSIEDLIYQEIGHSGITKISCYGTVDYVRLNGSRHSTVFSTCLEIQQGLIKDYLVFADLSGL